MKTKLAELYERYMRDGFPSRLQIERDMAAAVEQEKKESVVVDLVQLLDHAAAHGQKIYPYEVFDVMRKHGWKI